MKISNENISLEVIEHGGEMNSLKYKGIEVLYLGDTEYWSGKNPTLFPIVGSTFSKSYEIDGKTYSMKNHGIIRYSDLKCIENTDTKITMELKSDEETLKQYPFNFTYHITYELVGNRVNISYEIINDNDKDMPFSFGLHPAFKATYNHNVLEYAPAQDITQIIRNNSGVINKKIKMDKWVLNFTEIQENNTLIYKDIDFDYVDLLRDEYTLRLGIKGFPYFAVWTPNEKAPFICLEPWYGHGDFEDVKVEFAKREGTIVLKARETFTTSYYIELI